MISVTDVVGMVGALIILFAFYKNTVGDWYADQETYLFLNVIGSVLLVGVAITARQWHFVLLNLWWAGIALRKMFR